MKLARWILLALCATRLWLMPLGSSFWIDEIGTVFVVRMGAHHPSLALAPQVPDSLYFWLPRAVQWLLNHLPPWANGPGFLEVFYRVPSVICIACTILVIARVAARLIGSESAWFAAFACMALRGFDYQASDARPYALGTLVASTAVYCLIRWLDSARWLDAACFAAASAILWRVHLIYWPFYAVFILYAAVRLSRRETPVAWVRAGAVFGAVGIALVPVAFDALTLFRQAGAHVIVALPGRSELWRSLKIGLIALCGCGAWLLSCLGRGPTRGATRDGLGTLVPGAVPGASWTLILGWWLIQPLGLFTFSWLSGSSVFVDRYLSLALPGAVLTATACAASFLSGRQARIATLALAAGVLLFLGQWRQGWPPHHNSDWRGAAQAINALHLDSPVVMPSPFIEARPPAWSPSYSLPGFLYAHLLVYPVTGKPVLLPFTGGFYAGDLADRKRFVLYGGYPAIRDAREWFVAQPQFAGWRNRPLGDFGDVSAILFEPPFGETQGSAPSKLNP